MMTKTNSARTRRSPMEARFEQMRIREQKQTEIVNSIQAEVRSRQRAEWEKKTDFMMYRNMEQQKFESLREEEESKLNERKQRLSNLLNQEETDLAIEIEKNHTTAEERREKLLDRAKILRMKREEERKKAVDTLEYRKRRENCDLIRVFESNQITQYAAEDRKKQEQEKLLKREEEREETRAWDLVWEKDRLHKEEKHQEFMRRRKEIDDKNTRILNEQLIEREHQKALEKQRLQDERHQFRKRMEEEEQKAKDLDMANYLKSKALSEEMMIYNKIKQQEQHEEERLQKEADRAVVNESLQRAKEDELVEREAKEKEREASRVYRQHLLHTIATEKEGEDARNRLIEESEKVAHARQDEIWEKQRKASENLLADVLEIRNKQVESIHCAKQSALKEKAQERRGLDELAAKELEEIAKVEQRRKDKANYNRQVIERQIAEKGETSLRNKENLELEMAMKRKAEEQYTSMIKEEFDLEFEQQLGRNRSYGRKQVNLYN